MKGEGNSFNRISPNTSKKYLNGIDYNTANSISVKSVDYVSNVNEKHSLPSTYEKNSVIRNYKNGVLNSERYYDNNGIAYLDIDYTDHGNPKMHPYVPHEHKITYKNRKIHREKKGNKIKHE